MLESKENRVLSEVYSVAVGYWTGISEEDKSESITSIHMYCIEIVAHVREILAASKNRGRARYARKKSLAVLNNLGTDV